MSEQQKNRGPRRHGPMGGGPGGMMPGEKAKDFKGTFVKLLKYMGNYKYAVLVVMLFAVGGTVFNILGPKVLSKATTELFNGLMARIAGTGGIDFEKIGRILLLLLGLYVLSALLSFVQGYLMTGIAQKLSYRFRKEISEKINRMPMAYFESRTVGEILSRITNDVDTMGQNLSQSITTLITSLTTIIGVLVMMLSISPLMTLIALAILPISGGLIGLVIRFSQKHFVAQQNYLGKINGQIEETFSGQNIIKAFNKEEDTLRDFKETNEVLYASAWKSQFLSGLMQPVMTFVGNLGYVAVAISGSILVIQGVIDVGEIQAFIQYVKNFTQPITQLAQVSNLFQSTAAAAERVFEFLEEEEEDVTVENPVKLSHVDGAVSFDHVGFGYTPDKIVIKDFSCQVKPGQTIAIVGPTGAGKTTMVKLLMRFYDVNQGDILLNDQSIYQMTRHELRSHYGMVLQDTWLFKGTIRDNIAYGSNNATDEEIIEAAKKAHAHKFIIQLKGGYDAMLAEEGSNLSQGQRQLLSIARIMLVNPPMLILDEATSSIDTRTEQIVLKGMQNLMKGRTVFLIAHRLSTIQDAEAIMVLEHGRIIERGTHEQLIDLHGYYYQLYTGVFELE